MEPSSKSEDLRAPDPGTTISNATAQGDADPSQADDPMEIDTPDPAEPPSDHLPDDLAREAANKGASLSDLEAAVGLSMDQLNKALALAAASQSPQKVRALLIAGADAQAQDDQGRTALHHAVLGGNQSVIPDLLKAGCDEELVDAAGLTALALARKISQLGCMIALKEPDSLQQAAKAGRLSAVRALCRHLTDINRQNEPRPTALGNAAANGHMSVLKCLLEHGASVYATNHLGQTAFMEAAANGQLEAARKLFAEGSDIEHTANDLSSALHLAVQGNHRSMVEWLLSKGARINTPENPITFAMFKALEVPAKPHSDMVVWLLDKGANFSRPERFTALMHVAAKTGSLETLDWLIRHGQPPDLKDAQGNTPLHLAAQSGHAFIVERLLDEGADIDALSFERMEGGNRRTPLHEACCGGHGAVVDVLVRRHASLDEGDCKGETALFSAVDGGHEWVVYLLLRAGASIHQADGYRRTPLHAAVRRKHFGLTTTLLDRGVDIHGADAAGSTALHHAAATNWFQGIELLAKRGAAVGATDQKALTPLDIASKSGSLCAAVKLLDLQAPCAPKSIRTILAQGIALENAYDTVNAGRTIKYSEWVNSLKSDPRWTKDDLIEPTVEDSLAPEHLRSRLLLLDLLTKFSF